MFRYVKRFWDTRKHSLCSCLLLSVACLASLSVPFQTYGESGPGQDRIWTSADRHFTTRGGLLSFTNGTVGLKKSDGSVVNVRLDKFSLADQRYLRNAPWRVPSFSRMRTWTSSDGKFSTVAEFISLGNGRITLQKQDGAIVDVPPDRLSKVDQNYIDQRREASDKRPTRQKLTNVFVGSVVGVTDGDTITLLDYAKSQHKIRLEGIDAPEQNQPFGTQSKKALSDKVFSKQVFIEWSGKDKYGRTLGDIYLDHRWINKEMVDGGWAWHYKEYSNDQHLALAEQNARNHKAGLWTAPNPVAPWDFRNPPVVVSPPKQPPPSVTQAIQTTVYVTRTGHKYHRGSCRYLRQSKIPISLSSARRNYGACKVCQPP